MLRPGGGVSAARARRDRMNQWRMTSLIVVTWITTMLAVLLKH
jgi:hypothetical protein